MNKYLIGVCWEEMGYLICKNVHSVRECTYDEAKIHEQRSGETAYDLSEYDNTVVLTDDVSRAGHIALEREDVDIINYEELF